MNGFWHKLGICVWEKWKDAGEGTISNRFGGDRPVIFQERRCSICNKLDLRYVSPEEK